MCFQVGAFCVNLGASCQKGGKKEHAEMWKAIKPHLDFVDKK